MAEKEYSILTSKQAEAYRLKEEGNSYAKVAALLGVSPSRARCLYLSAERRFREHERYLSAEKRKLEPITLTITRGEVELLQEAVFDLQYKLRASHCRANTDWEAYVPYEYRIATVLMEKLENSLHNEKKSNIDETREQDIPDCDRTD